MSTYCCDTVKSLEDKLCDKEAECRHLRGRVGVAEAKLKSYKQTRDFAGVVTTRFSKMLRNLSDDIEEEMVVCTLTNYYDLIDKDDADLMWAIDRVLQDFMTTEDYNSWKKGLS